MTIDISNLSPEKRAFLKVRPDLLKRLEEEIPKQVRGFQVRSEKLNKGRAKWQRDLDEAKETEELLREYGVFLDESLRKINQRFMEEAVKGGGALVCPVCGDSDHGNKMNGKAWCFKCNSPLVAESKVEAWKKLPAIKVLAKDLKDELRRLNPGLYPKEEDEKCR